MQVREARVLISGGTRGIGRALAAGLLGAGAQVTISGRNPGHLERAKAELDDLVQADGRVLAVCGDVAVDDDALAMVDGAVEAFGGLDLLINNAAILTPPAPIVETLPETWRAVLNVNVIGTANMVRHALPALAAAGGAVVNVSSTWGRTAAGEVAPYCASKFAVEALTQSLAQEAPSPVAVLAVNPGVINTEMLATAFGGDVSMYPSPESLVPAWLRLLAEVDAAWRGRSVDLAHYG